MYLVSAGESAAVFLCMCVRKRERERQYSTQKGKMTVDKKVTSWACVQIMSASCVFTVTPCIYILGGCELMHVTVFIRVCFCASVPVCVLLSEAGETTKPMSPRGSWKGSGVWALMWHGDNEALTLRPPGREVIIWSGQQILGVGWRGGWQITWQRCPHSSATLQGTASSPLILQIISERECVLLLSKSNNHWHFYINPFVKQLCMTQGVTYGSLSVRGKQIIGRWIQEINCIARIWAACFSLCFCKTLSKLMDFPCNTDCMMNIFRLKMTIFSLILLSKSVCLVQ